MISAAMKCQGVREFGNYGDSGMAWCVLESHVTDREIRDRWPSYYGGTGREFCARVVIRRVKKRVLVTQMFGLDI